MFSSTLMSAACLSRAVISLGRCGGLQCLRGSEKKAHGRQKKSLIQRVITKLSNRHNDTVEPHYTARLWAGTYISGCNREVAATLYIEIEMYVS